LEGLTDNLLYNILPVTCIAILVFILIMVIPKIVLNTVGLDKDSDEYKHIYSSLEIFKKIGWVFTIFTYAVVVILCLAFLSNPRENKSKSTIIGSEYNPSYQNQKEPEISKSNNESVTKKAADMNREASEDNSKAMSESFKVFDDAEKSAN